MDKTPEEIEAIYTGYEELGEEKVRMYRETGKYGEASGNMALSKLWLEQKDRDRLNNAKKPWYETSWGIVILGLLVTVVGGGILFWLGWPG